MKEEVRRAICPYCKKEMIPIFTQDADEGFWSLGWSCNCDDIKRLEEQCEKEEG